MNFPVAVTAAATTLFADNLVVPELLAKGLRRADDFIRLAVTAAHAALASAPPGPLGPEETGVFVGTVHGPLATNFEFLDSLLDDGEGQASPTLFSHSVYNAAAGYVTRLLDIRGPALTATTFSWPFLSALTQAQQALCRGRIRRALALGVETGSPLLKANAQAAQRGQTAPWQAGAVAWILDIPDAKTAPQPLLQGITLDETACDAVDLLCRTGESWHGLELPANGQYTGPLAYALALTHGIHRLRSGLKQSTTWTITAPFGQAGLVFTGGNAIDRETMQVNP